MKQIIPFNKNITFKTNVYEITSISLDHDLVLKGEDLITGNFYIRGDFKENPSSIDLVPFDFKIPVDVAISDMYDTFSCTIDIDDFYYSLKDNITLNLDIKVVIDNLVEKERCIEEETIEVEEPIENIIEEKREEIEIEQEDNEINKKLVLNNIAENPINIIADNNELNTYQTYYVYLTKEGDSFETLKEKYKSTKEDILNYNDIKELTPGIKIIIPECK